MTEQAPTIGRIVHYTMTERDVAAVLDQHRDKVGRTLNIPRPGQAYPAVIVTAWGDQPTSAVNLRVMLDGLVDYWATSRTRADERQADGRWAWPPRT